MAAKKKPKKKTKKKAVTGRPSKYTKSLGLKICKKLMAGESLSSITDGNSMPHKATVFRWLMATIKKNNDNGEDIVVAKYPEFRDSYYNARKIQYSAMADEMIDICDDSRNDYMVKKMSDGSEVEVVNSEAIQRSKLRIDTRFKVLSKVDPERWGDKVQHQGAIEHNHQGAIEHKAVDGMNFEQVRDERAKLRVINNDT